MAVKHRKEPRAFPFIGAHDGMNHFCEKAEELLILTAKEIQAHVVINPIITPIEEVAAVEVDIARHIAAAPVV